MKRQKKPSIQKRMVLPRTGQMPAPAAPAPANAGFFSPRVQDWLLGLFLVIATMFAYKPVWHAGFIWDDDSWTSGIYSLLHDFKGLDVMWCNPTALQQYYPITGTSFWIDYHLWGFWSPPYHMENILLHAFAALLFWKLLERLQVTGAKLAGAIFAFHPLMVESVAWVTERKNTLSLVFYLGALLAYAQFMNFWKVKAGSQVAATRPPVRRWDCYALAFLLFLCALLAKATAFSLPAVILLVCWWKRGRIQWRPDVLPTVPFFMFAAGLSGFTSWLEKHHVGAVGADWNHAFPERCLIAGRAICFYAGKLFCPVDLCFVYPQWQLNAGSPAQWIYPAGVIGLLLALWLARNWIGRGPIAAALFFVGTLFPVLGFMNVYGMRFSFVWDHWVYLSSLGLIALGASTISRIVGQFRRPAMIWGFAAVLLPVLATLTWRQCGMYADGDTLWRTTIVRNPDAWLAYNNLGAALAQKNDVDGAIVQYRKALQIKPGYAEAHCNLGNAFAMKGQVDDAIAEYRMALETEPDNVKAHNNLGDVLATKGQTDEAIIQYQMALKIKPDYFKASYDLGNALFDLGRLPEAIEQYQTALKTEPDFVEARFNLGNAFFQKGELDKAIEQYRMVLKTKPDYVGAHNNLGAALMHVGSTVEAVGEYRKTLDAQPQNIDALDNLAWMLATASQAALRNGVEAVQLAQKAVQLDGGKNPLALRTLAAAYAETGRYADAAETARRALRLAVAAGNAALAGTLQQEIELYDAGTPVRDMKP
jgi:protein O-mannosyl-transferase